MGVQRMVFVSATFPPFPASVPLKGYIEGKTGKSLSHAGGHVFIGTECTTLAAFSQLGQRGSLCFLIPCNVELYAFERRVANCDTGRWRSGLLMPLNVALQRRRRRFVSGFPSRIRFSSPP